jgi:hypothetical protein
VWVRANDRCLFFVRARQAKSKVRVQQFDELVSKAKGRVRTKQVELAAPEERERQQRLGGVVALFSGDRPPHVATRRECGGGRQ